MDLAVATGRGPAALANLEGRGPLGRDEDVVAFAFRDEDEQARYGSQPLAAGIHALDLAAVRRMGITRAAAEAMRHLARRDLDGFFLHVDADVLDDAIMPAVDYRLPGGLSAVELRHVLRAAADSGRLAGLEVTIYNPALDHDGSAGRLLDDALVDGLSLSRRVWEPLSKRAPSTTRTSLPLESITYGFQTEPKVICAPDCALTLSASPHILTGYERSPSVLA